MRNVVCWDPAEVRQVINPFAEHMPDSLFRAVHTDWDLKVSPPVGTSFQQLLPSNYADVAPADFLDDFLRSDRPHALAVVLGMTGSGKSHLIHWMRLNLKEDDTRLVLTVRKAGTSLRAIVEMIIGKLPARDQQGFRDTLNRAGEGTNTRDGQKQQLLNDIAHSIREDTISEDDADPELERELIAQLPHIFQDPYMREAHFLKGSTIVADIVDHIFAPSNARNRPDQRRLFEEHDLPLGGLDFAHASKNAQNALNVIDLETGVSRPLAIRIINRNLDKATARTLSFSGDRVEELMGRLRTHLKKQGRELILLVEEFARLQGIDRALLQAITHQGDDQFCRMRSAIAVTTGFFESVAETAYMRTTHIVDMDRSAGRHDGKQVTRDTLSDFTARYLNAVRLGRDAIDEWSVGAEPGDPAPTRCASCVHQPECHPIFGAVDGYGLYPFTPTALWNAARRVDQSLPESLNPRILQNDLLAEILDVNEPSIEAGLFPTPQLLAKLGGPSTLSLSARTQLRTSRPESVDRLIAFLEIYDGSGVVKNLPSNLREAFSVPEITAADESPETIVEPQAPEVPREKSIDPNDAAIEDWVGGAGLDQNVANSLRLAIFAAVSESIDWDMLGLGRTAFAGKAPRAFQTVSVAFDRQTTQVPSHLQVKLRIPGVVVDPEMVGLALQGLLRATRNHFRWDFENGGQMLAAFLDCVDAWSRDVENQLKIISGPKAHWSASAAALELLCVGAAVGGRIKQGARVGDMVDAAFSVWPPECQAEASEIRTLYDRVLKKREKLVEIARSHISSMKGGQVGPMIDPRKVVGAIRAFRQQKWRLVMKPPSDERADYAVLAKLYAEVQSSIDAAVLAECSLRSDWLRDMQNAFGTSSRATIVEGLAELRRLATATGVAAGGNSNPLASALETFGAVQFDDAIAAASSLNKESVSENLPNLGRGRRAAVIAGRDLKSSAENFLQNVTNNLEAFSADFKAKYGAVDDSIKVIDASLVAIETSLVALGPRQMETPNAP